MYRFKRAFYENPDREHLNALWWDLVEEIQLADHPLDRDEPDWAAKIHVAIAPVYYHNYVLGHLTAAQLRDYPEKPVVGSPFTSTRYPTATSRKPSSAPVPARTGGHRAPRHRGSPRPEVFCGDAFVTVGNQLYRQLTTPLLERFFDTH